MKKPRLGNAALGQLTGSNVQDVLHRLPFTRELQEALHDLPPDALAPNPWQPREHAAPEDLEELRQSILAHGVLEPILARRLPDGTVQVLAGHRRLAAAKLAGLDSVPVRELTATDAEALAVALTENLTRTDLTAWEEAQGLAGLRVALQDAGEKVTRDKLAALAGRSGGSVSESLAIAEALTPEVVEAAGVTRHALTKLPKTALLLSAQGATIDLRAKRLRAAADALENRLPTTRAVRQTRGGARQKTWTLTASPEKGVLFRLRKPPAALEPEEARAVLERLSPVVDQLRARAGLPPVDPLRDLLDGDKLMADLEATLAAGEELVANFTLPDAADLDGLLADLQLPEDAAAAAAPPPRKPRKRGNRAR